MTKELLQQCLDALLPHSSSHGNSWRAVEDAAIEALKQALAQQEQPASVDAYVGAREDAAIWKKRALEAEELNRKFIADVNGPTYLGEPVKQEQPAQEPMPGMAVTALAGEIIEALLADEKDGGYDLTSGLFGANFSTLVRRWAKAEWGYAPSTQPALSETDVWNSNEIMAANSEIGLSLDKLMKLVRAIEAHCRGGASHMNNQEFQERVVEILENLVSSMDQRDFGWVLRQVRNLYEDVREAAKQGRSNAK